MMNTLFLRLCVWLLPACLLYKNTDAQKISLLTDVQVQTKVTRYLVDDSLVVASTGYRYDVLGRLTDIINLKTGISQLSLSYLGDVPVKISSYDINRKSALDINAAFDLLDKGNTIRITTIAPGKNRSDTAQLLYTFNGTTLQSRSILVNAGDFSSNYSCWPAYDDNGNLISIVKVVGKDTTTVAKVLEWDDKKNPLNNLTRYNFIFMQNDFPLGDQGAHNVTRYLDNTGKEIDLEITYNEAGYPLTCQKKGEDFIADEFIYAK